MLAQNFKTAADLGLQEIEIVALIKVLGMLERDEIRHTPVDHDQSDYMRRPRKVLTAFNMEAVFSRTGCGTAGCIAGSADFFFGTKFSSNNAIRRDIPDALNSVFCPWDVQKPWGQITADEAARALRSYLTTGAANWDEALA